MPHTLKDAAVFLAERCDYAATLDGAGYNKPDSSFGHGLAVTEEPWSAPLQREAWEMLRKYQGQLRHGRIDFASIPEPPDALELHDKLFGPIEVEQVRAAGRAHLRKQALANGTVIDVESDHFVIMFPSFPGHVILGEIRALPGRFYDGERNIVPLTSAKEVKDFADNHRFSLTPDAVDAIDVGMKMRNDLPPDTRVELVGNEFHVFFPRSEDEIFDQRLEFIRGLPGRKWDRVLGGWIIPAASGMALLKWADGNEFLVSDDARAYVAEAASRVEASFATDSDIVIEGLTSEYQLRPFQKAGVHYIANAFQTGSGCLLADEMGLGKTIQAIAASVYTDRVPVLVVCPASLKLNWKREIQKWLPDDSVTVVQGSKPWENADWVIVNYDILGRQLQALKSLQPRMLILDESHYVKSTAAKRTKYVTELAQVAEKSLLLTGTPIANRPEELLSQLRIMGRLSEVAGGYRAFMRSHVWPYNPDLAGLGMRLRETCMVRRTKEEVLTELPDKIVEPVEVPLSNHSEYKRAEADFVAWLIENNYAPDGVVTFHHLAQLAVLRRLAGEGKVQGVIDWSRDFLDSTDRKLVLFAHHKSIQGELAEDLAPYGVCQILGGQPEVNDAEVQRFQNDSSQRVMVASLLAGGVGHTMTAASHAVIVELAWTPKDMNQAADRLHRMGQQLPVNVYWALSEQQTIDQHIWNIIQHKMQVCKSITDPGEAAAVETQSVEAEVIKAIWNARASAVAA
jgi:hypothetical protein